MKRLPLVLFLALLSTEPAAAQTDAELRDIAATYGLTAPQARHVYGLYDRQRVILDRLADERRVRRQTIRAAALALGARQPNLSAEAFVKLAAAKADEAALANSQLVELKSFVERVDPGGLRTRALGLLKRAQKAFDAGQFDLAEQEIAALRDLRSLDSAAAADAWLRALETQARILLLKGDYDRAADLARTARLQERALSERRQWRFVLIEADAKYQKGSLLGDRDEVVAALALLRDVALPMVPREARRLDWSMTQYRIGVYESTLGERDTNNERLKSAIDAFKLSLSERSLVDTPQEWGESHLALGATLRKLGEGRAGTQLLEEAITSFDLASKVMDREKSPQSWAQLQNHIGIVYDLLGQRGGGIDKYNTAIAYYEVALQVAVQGKFPGDWASIQNNRGASLWHIAELSQEADYFDKSIDAYELTLGVRTLDHQPVEWAKAKYNIATVIRSKAIFKESSPLLEESIYNYKDSLRGLSTKHSPKLWAQAQSELGLTLILKSEFEEGVKSLEEAVSAYQAAEDVLRNSDSKLLYARALVGKAGALMMIGGRNDDVESFVSAKDAAAECKVVASALGDSATVRRAELIINAVEIGLSGER